MRESEKSSMRVSKEKETNISLGFVFWASPIPPPPCVVKWRWKGVHNVWLLSSEKSVLLLRTFCVDLFISWYFSSFPCCPVLCVASGDQSIDRWWPNQKNEPSQRRSPPDQPRSPSIIFPGPVKKRGRPHNSSPTPTNWTLGKKMGGEWIGWGNLRKKAAKLE